MKPSVPAPEDLLAFAPVPRLRETRHGWTPETQRAFIAALSHHGIVARAARAVAKSPRSAHQLRARPGAEGFARAWDDALEAARLNVEEAIMDAAFAPLRRPVVHRGKIVGDAERPNHRAMMMAIHAQSIRNRVHANEALLAALIARLDANEKRRGQGKQRS